jgi:hypothetical protein
MQTAGAHVLGEDDQDLTREAVLLQWERKIEAAEGRPGRFERESPARETATADGAGLRPVALPPAPVARPEPGRRTITITGQPTPARRRSTIAQRQLAQPDRIALWAFLLGLFLVAVAAGTAHA